MKNESGQMNEYLMAVIAIRSEKHNKQRFYVHETIAIKKEELLFKTGIDSKRNKEIGNSSSSIYNILQRIVNYNEEDEKTQQLKEYFIDVDANNFAKEYDAWDKKNPTKIFKVGIVSDALKSIGITERDITIDSSKLIKIKA